MRYRIFNVTFLMVLLTLLPASAAGFIAWKWPISLVAAYPLALFVGAVSPKLQFFTPQLRHGSMKGLSLTFDDGPHPDITPKILDILNHHGVKGTFFCKGHLVEKHPEIAARIVQDGHIIGNHTYTHSFGWGWHRFDAALREIMDAQRAIRSVTGKIPLYFRPPYGITNPHIARAIAQQKLHAIAWDLRSMDTVAASADQVMVHIGLGLKKATIILLHDHLSHTPEVVSRIIAYCKKNGTEIVPLDQMTGLKPYV